MIVARSLQGAISQFAWSVGLALAVSLPPCAGVAATAWAMTGNSVGEVGSVRCTLQTQTPPQA